MESLTYGTLPSSKELTAAIGTEAYEMQLTSQDGEVVTAAINQGIDSHLEAVRFEQFDAGHKLGIRIEPDSMHTLLRRLTEIDDDHANDLVSSILYTLNFEWV